MEGARESLWEELEGLKDAGLEQKPIIRSCQAVPGEFWKEVNEASLATNQKVK